LLDELENGAALTTATARCFLGFFLGGTRHELLAAVVAAEVERLTVAVSVNRSRFIHVHSTHGIFGHELNNLSFVAMIVIKHLPCRACSGEFPRRPAVVTAALRLK
jgi:hypothetical protein